MSEITYSTITVSGADSFDFLQAQLATDMTLLERDIPQRSTWCNPKGRVICMPFIEIVVGGFDLSLPADLAASVVQRMTLFRFRSKVEFATRDGHIAGIPTPVDLLQAGVPEIALAQSEKFTPHMLNLDLLQLVSLSKGCYPGQEIVARTHYRGASRRRCLRFRSSQPVTAGDKVSDGDRDIGEVVNAIGNDLLAVVPLDMADKQLNVGDCKLLQLPLPYL